MEFKEIILGGTFDRLHEGHKAFLYYAFEHGEKVLIGLTSDAYVSEHKSTQNILPFAERKKELEEFLSGKQLLTRARIVAIDSRFDETQITDAENTALLVSSETYQSGLEINKERKKQGLQSLPLLVMPLVLTKTGEKISSSKIREGMFDRKGNFLPDQFIRQQIFIPDLLRKSLHKPFGTLYMEEIPENILKNSEKLVTVGDVTTKRIHDLHIFPKLAVVDFKVERKNTHEDLSRLGFAGTEEVCKVHNPAGKIMPDIWKALATLIKEFALSRNFAVVVEEEEDLLVIPLLLLLPLGYTILYGQPQEGVVNIAVTEDNKQQLVQLLQEYL